MGLFFTYSNWRYMTTASRFRDHYCVVAVNGRIGMYIFVSEDEMGRDDVQHIMAKRVKEYFPTGKVSFQVKAPVDAVVITSFMKINMTIWKERLDKLVNG